MIQSAHIKPSAVILLEVRELLCYEVTTHEVNEHDGRLRSFCPVPTNEQGIFFFFATYCACEGEGAEKE